MVCAQLLASSESWPDLTVRSTSFSAVAWSLEELVPVPLVLCACSTVPVSVPIVADVPDPVDPDSVPLVM